MNSSYKNLLDSFVRFIIIFILGTIGYYYISDYESSIIDCFYMTALTITTIGFTEVIDLTDKPYGRLFTVLISFLGIGMLTYFFSHVTALLIDGKFKNDLIRRKMKNKINHLKDHYIICGAGRIGINIAKDLVETKKNFVMIDNLPNDKYAELTEKYEYYVNGDATEDETLLNANIKGAKGIFVATGIENVNLVITMTARLLNRHMRIISRSLDETHAKKIKKAGANSVILPTTIGGFRMISEMIKPEITSFMDTIILDQDDKCSVEAIKVGEAFNNRTLSELNLRNYPDTVILAKQEHKDKNFTFNPDRKTPLKRGDVLIVITSSGEKALLQKIVG